MKFIYILFLILTLAFVAQAQPADSTWLTQAERAKFEQLRISGSEALYNLDYESARKIFKEMAVDFPDSYLPGRSFWRTRLLIEALYQTRRLQASLYNSESFYSKNEDKADLKLVDQFRTHTRQARHLVEARLKLNPNDTEALYFFGAIEGLKASFEETVERRHLAALKDGNDAVDKHRAGDQTQSELPRRGNDDWPLRLHGWRAAVADEDRRRLYGTSRIKEARHCDH